MKTSELTRAALDWAVSHCVEWSSKFPNMPFKVLPYSIKSIALSNSKYCPIQFKVLPYSTDWSQGGPIIEREKISIEYMAGAGDAGADVWVATMTFPDKKFGGVAFSEEQGPTPLIAAMRCYVASKMGDEIKVPDELKSDLTKGE